MNRVPVQRAVILAIIAAAPPLAEGTVSLSFSGSATSATTPAIVDQQWELTLIANTTATNDPAVFNITTDNPNNDIIRSIKVRSYDPDRDTIITIGTTTARIKSVGQVTLDVVGGGNTADDGYTIVNAEASDELGPTAWRVHSLGNVNAAKWSAPLTLATHATKTASISAARVTGDWTGNITFESNTQGFVETLTAGRFGIISPSTPVTVQLPGDWDEFNAGEVNATIRGKSTLNSSTSYIGAVRQFTVGGQSGQSGIFKGKLMATRLSDASGGDSNRFIRINNQLESGSPIILAQGLR